ncbi:sensor histidine kinase [Mycetocola tolaasinivorans]|nr:ATP-binding protein [Mycetocola tolaasinivorans]
MIFRPKTETDVGIERTLSWLFAIGGCVVFLDQAIFRFDELALWQPWWNAGGFVIIAGIIVLAAGALVLPIGVVRALCRVLPPLYTTLQFLWVPAMISPNEPTVTSWISTLEPPMVAMLLLSLRPVAAVCASLLISATPALSSLLFLGTVPFIVLRETPIQLGNVLYVVIFLAVFAQLTRLRMQEREMHRQRQHQAQSRARGREHARVSRVIHDEVLSAMAAAIQTEGVPPMVLKRTAAVALSALDDPADGAPHQATPTLTLERAYDVMTLDLRRIDDRVELRAELGAGSIPTDVASAATLAAAEALRNSIRHAGDGATRSVEVLLGQGKVEIRVSDDGRGFNPEHPHDGLGIRESIVRRMAEVGGEARVTSLPERGTRVVISWPR